ncbi:MAG: ABC transporter permease subunit, partial [Campylobacter concisus]|nr:ABC transporter permease subunit [Campylobacter concisus]
ASKMQIITGVIMPASLFSIISGLKLAASLAWINLVVGEMVGAQSGLGYLIIDARNQLRIDSVMAVIFVIGVIGIVINFIFSLIERYAGERLGR